MVQKTCPSCKQTRFSSTDFDKCDVCGADLSQVEARPAEETKFVYPNCNGCPIRKEDLNV